MNPQTFSKENNEAPFNFKSMKNSNKVTKTSQEKSLSYSVCSSIRSNPREFIKSLNPSELKSFHALHLGAVTHKVLFYKHETWAEKAGISESQHRRNFAKFEKLGIVQVDRYHRSPNFYQVSKFFFQPHLRHLFSFIFNELSLLTLLAISAPNRAKLDHEQPLVIKDNILKINLSTRESFSFACAREKAPQKEKIMQPPKKITYNDFHKQIEERLRQKEEENAFECAVKFMRATKSSIFGVYNPYLNRLTPQEKEKFEQLCHAEKDTNSQVQTPPQESPKGDSAREYIKRTQPVVDKITTTQPTSNVAKMSTVPPQKKDIERWPDGRPIIYPGHEEDEYGILEPL